MLCRNLPIQLVWRSMRNLMGLTMLLDSLTLDLASIIIFVLFLAIIIVIKCKASCIIEEIFFASSFQGNELPNISLKKREPEGWLYVKCFSYKFECHQQWYRVLLLDIPYSHIIIMTALFSQQD